MAKNKIAIIGLSTILFFNFLVLLPISLSEDVPNDIPSSVGSYTFNWDNFWRKFRNIAKWRLQWLNGSVWQKGGRLRIIRKRINDSIVKIALNFTSKEAGAYRLLFAIEKVIKKYVNKTNNFQYVLDYDGYSMTFDWRDLENIPQLIFKHGITDNHFWFLIRRNNIPASRTFILDPTFIANTSTVTGTWNSNQWKVVNASSRYWAFFSDGGLMRGMSSTDGNTWINTPDNSTGIFSPTSHNGSWIDGEYAFSSNDAPYARSVIDNDQHDYHGYGFSSVSDSEIEIGIEAYQLGTGEWMIIDYSTDGGNTFTSGFWSYTPPSGADPQSQTWKSLGTLTPSQFSDANFRVRIEYRKAGRADWIYLDWLPCRMATSGIRDASRGYKFSITSNETHIHYAYSSEDADSPIYYRMGEALVNGTIDWEDDEQIAVIAGLSYYYFYPNIALDSNGYPFITHTRFYRSAGQWRYQPRVAWSSLNNGTWATDRLQTLGSNTIIKWATGIATLNSSRMYAVYCVATAPPLGRLWNGTTWGSQEIIASGYEILVGYLFSIISIDDDVYFSWQYLSQPSPTDTGMLFKTRVYGAGWGNLERPMNGSVFAVISKLESGDNIYAFWANITDDTIYYMKRLLGIWDVQPTSWLIEDNLISGSLTGYSQEWGDEMAFIWMNGTSSPYAIRFASLTPVIPPVEITFFSFLIPLLFLVAVISLVLYLGGIAKHKKK